ncbi:TonB-dependent receptor [uncultured Bacteroides sp.]|uniref:SusC/RagA family TonB-linked outer membrane protein n=1 Tax=uncultured Bacteroides sp. TaxID=162156 RepID=UPI002AAC119E|nr:TonB-dependent receptor [uncultured Bacteroides sp.]
MNRKALAKKVFATLFLSMLCLVSFAQGHLVTGAVTDANGEPMIGVNVSAVGTTNGTITDMNGHYSLSVPANSKLQFSFIGYLTKIIAINNQSKIDAKLVEDSKTLDEVVVIGYGTVKKRDLTGSVASINNEALIANPVSNVAQALQGHLPGVSVMSQDGRPGADVSIRVRGGGSITQSNDPLFIVDGFPVGSISDIPADQIESIDVLKDASSTAIYGARGANGVILVTTKGAKSEKLSVSYNSYMQVKNAAKTLDVLGAQDYIYNTWSYATALGSSYSDAVASCFGLGSANGNHYSDYAKISSHDYTNDLLRSVISQSHNLSISGGNDKTRIAFATNYLDDAGIKIKSGYNRFNTSLKVQQQLLPNLRLDFDVRYTESKTDGKEDSATNGKGSLLSNAYSFRPIDTPLGTGVFSGFGNGDSNVDQAYNVLDLVNDVTQISRNQNLRGITSLSWDIIKGLTARTELNLSRGNSESKYYENGLTNGYKYAKLNKGDSWGVRSATTLNYQVQGLGETHNLSFLLGNEVLASKSNSSQMIGAGYSSSFDFNRAFGMINMTNPALGKDQFSNTIGTPSNTLSFFGRANYSFKGRYLFTGTFRADGSSKFAPNNHWAYFPAGAFAWRISDEPFLSDSKNWLDNLKLRLSYGTSGADNIDASLWKETWTTSNVTINGVSTTIYKPAGMLSNPDLKWETTVSRNIGLDFGFWNNRLYGSVDAYWNNTKDLLMQVPIDETTGYSYQIQNIGKTSNKGIEISLGADIIRQKDFTLNVTANYNYNKNNIDELADNVTAQYGTQWASTATQPNYDYLFRVGSQVGLIRGFKCDGYYTTNDFNYDSSTGTYTLKSGVADLSSKITGNYPSPFKKPTGQNAFPGAVKLRDTNDDKIVDDKDVTDLGEVTPKHTGGFNLNMNYKHFDLSAGFAWAIGGKIYNANAMVNMYGNKDVSLGANRLDFVKDCYKVYDINTSGNLEAVTDPTALDALNTNAKYGLPYYENGIVLSTFVEDASYLRMNTLTLGYTLPKQLIKKLSIQRLRFYATAGNLFTITGYSGLDPEVNTFSNKSTTANAGKYPTLGLDWGTYPRARTFTFGLNLEF